MQLFSGIQKQGKEAVRKNCGENKYIFANVDMNLFRLFVPLCPKV